LKNPYLNKTLKAKEKVEGDEEDDKEDEGGV